MYFDCNAATGEIHWTGTSISFWGSSLAKCHHRQTDWLKWVHEEDRDKLLQQRLAARDTKSAYQAVYRCNIKDGEWKWLQENGVAAVDETTQTVHWYGALEDISQRKQDDINLLQYRFALDHTSMPSLSPILREPSSISILHLKKYMGIPGKKRLDKILV